MMHLIDMLPSPGMTDSVCAIYLATACRPVEHDRHGPEEQEMELMHVPLDDALAMVDRGEIADAKTVVSPGRSKSDKWIEVDLSDQRLYAHEGQKTVLTAVVSILNLNYG